MREWLRTKHASAIWASMVLWAVLLISQMLLSWPIARRSPVVLRPETVTPDGVIQGKIKSPFTVTPWSVPVVRISAGGQELPQSRTLDRLRESTLPASYVKGRSVYLRLPAGGAMLAWTARVPWTPTLLHFAGAIFGSLAFSFLLRWAGNPVFEKVTALVRWDGVLLLVLAATLAGAFSVRFFGLSFPVWTDDSGDYLRPALQFLHGQTVDPTERPFGYPLFAWAILRIWDDLRAMVIVQQIVSIAAGLTLAAIIVVAGQRLFGKGRLRRLSQLVALLALAGFTLHEGIVQRDWWLVPEAVVAAYMSLQLWLGWRQMTARAAGWRLGAEYAIFCAAGWMIYFTKPNWGLAVGALPFPILIGALLRSRGARTFWGDFGKGLLVLALISALAYLAQTRWTPRANTLISLEVRARVLICWHVRLVKPEIQRRLAAHPGERERALLEELAPLLEEELELTKRLGPGVYRLLGHDGDRLHYIGFEKAHLYRSLPLEERIQFGTALFFGAVRHDPGAYAVKVARQMSNLQMHPYNKGTLSLPDLREELALSERWVEKPPPYVMEPLRSRYATELRAGRAILESNWPSAARAALRARTASVFGLLTASLGWTIGLPMLIVVAASLWPRWHAAVPWRQLAPVLGIAGWATASGVLSALSSSLAQALEIQRYIDLFMPMTLLSELLWPLIGLRVVLAWRRVDYPSSRDDAALYADARNQ